MGIKKRGYDGRTRDISLTWLIENHGKEWEGWRQLANEWLSFQEAGNNSKLDALVLFFDSYLVLNTPWASDITVFFKGTESGWKPSSEELKFNILKNTRRSDNNELKRSLNYIFNFIEWILETHLSEKNDNGHVIRLYNNPLDKALSKQTYNESVHNPLPYRYICELRKILCPIPKGSFKDWLWTHEQSGQGNTGGDWFEVDKYEIDRDDVDCVWRTKNVRRKDKEITIYQIWSPVAAVALFIKLHLPLRTYQVRMLDSGEADTMRYEDGSWNKNTKHSFSLQNRRKGVFRQFKDNARGFESTGLYINTNKTADQNRDELGHGYEIPWENKVVLYWLEKLRNWQEKYNPIYRPTDCTTLAVKHTKHLKSKASLSNMGHICFLMRDVASNKQEDKHKPIEETRIIVLWYKLLENLENKLFKSGDTLSNGTPVKLVHDYGKDHKAQKKRTEFPLHSLRVSLITSYILDAKLPLPIVSKLLAGHSRLLMTLYYTKLTPAIMKDKMLEADKALEEKSTESIRIFLQDAEMRQIKCKTAFHDGESIESALMNRNPIGWEKRHYGLCLAGGNTAKSEGVSTVAGCWNGGEIIRNSKIPTQRVHAPVSHGAENCVRCRWFITDASYLPALNAHLNFMSYKAHQAASTGVKLEVEIEILEEQKYEAEKTTIPFLKHHELQALRRRHEKQITEADEYTKDLIATFDLIYRIVEIEENRGVSDIQNKLVAVGAETDIIIGFTETNSNLLHLSLLCEDAEIYPDLLDDVKKTSIIQDRTQILSQIMMRKGFIPVLVSLDSDQQLIAANAMMRQMALQANPTDKVDGYQQVASYLDLGVYMEDERLFNTGIDALKEKTVQSITGISIKSLSKSKNGRLTYEN